MPDLKALADALAPAPTTAWAVVGHAGAETHAWIEGGCVRVAVTLTPSGEEVVALLPDGGGGDGFLVWMPVWPGVRVVVMEVGEEWVVIARLPDTARPQPTEVDGLPAFREAAPAPGSMFIRTPSGTMLSISTDDGSDVLVASGGSIQLKVGEGEQILLVGRTHIGNGFSSPPASALADGVVTTPGVGGGAYTPVPNTNLTLPPPLPTVPAEGIVRCKDTVQSNALVDPSFWLWVGWVTTVLTQYVALMNTGPGIPVLTLGPASLPPPLITTSVESQHTAASRHTCGD